MKTLVLAEKPSVGKDIARVLNCGKAGGGHMEGGKYVVTWALGHLVTLADPENYDPKFKTWDLNDLPIMPDTLKLVVIGQSAKQFSVVKENILRNDINEIVIATDAGREGELVARWILEKIHCKKPVKRLWISSVTDKAIREGFAKLKDGREYLNLYDSAQARAQADWLVGINATRCLTVKYNSQLSCGRVQTPTIAIIAAREEEIRNFKPQKYFGLSALSGNTAFTWQDAKSNDTRSFNEERIRELHNNLRNIREGTVVQLTKTHKKKLSPHLYDLTELQRDANKRYGFSPKDTLDIMQSLYETHKILTYPRTDSRFITSDIVPTLKERLNACAVGPYAKLCGNVLRGSITSNPNFVDDKKVSDHHAIIPTEQPVLMGRLNDRELKIYDLVVRRFLSVLYPPFEYEQTTVKVKIGNEFFSARGQVVIAQGFKAVTGGSYDSDDEEEESSGVRVQTLPKMSQGDKIRISDIKVTEGRTSPPSLFNEATLLSAMENPSKYTSDKSLAKTLGETGGLGTVATRADIIEKLLNTFLIEKNGKNLVATSKGRQLLKLVPDELKSPELTGKWEQLLLKISKGELKKDAFLKDIRQYTKSIILEIKQSTATFRHENITGTRCPECGKFMLEVNGKKGKMLVCQDRECGYRQSVSFISNARCPQCHKRMEIWGEDEKKRFVCECGFREKYSVFVEKNKENFNRVNKHDIEKYMHDSNKDNSKNNAMADALKNIKF